MTSPAVEPFSFHLYLNLAFCLFQMPVPGCPSVSGHSGFCCPPLPLRHCHAPEDELQRPRGAASRSARGGLLHWDGNRWVPEAEFVSRAAFCMRVYFSLSLNVGVTSGVKHLCWRLGLSSVGPVLFGVLFFFSLWISLLLFTDSRWSRQL